MEISHTYKLVATGFAQGKVTTSYLNTFDEYQPSCIEVIDGGLSTSIQDLRPRLLAGGDGIPRSGAMDHLAAKAANALVGNPAETEVIEATLRSVPRDPDRALLTVFPCLQWSDTQVHYRHRRCSHGSGHRDFLGRRDETELESFYRSSWSNFGDRELRRDW